MLLRGRGESFKRCMSLTNKEKSRKVGCCNMELENFDLWHEYIHNCRLLSNMHFGHNKLHGNTNDCTFRLLGLHPQLTANYC